MGKELVFDIGANNGDDAAEYLKQRCRVVAIEANPELCESLRIRFAQEIDTDELILVDRAISPRQTVTLYVNSSDHGWGTILPSYAAHGAKLRGSIVPIQVETNTLIDLFRKYGVPDRMKMDIEGADIEVIASMMGAEVPRHLSIEMPKSLGDQLLVLALLRRLGYKKLAIVEQTTGGKQLYSTTCLFGPPSAAWGGLAAVMVRAWWLYGQRLAAGILRLTPGLRSFAPAGRWFDIHASLHAASVRY